MERRDFLRLLPLGAGYTLLNGCDLLTRQPSTTTYDIWWLQEGSFHVHSQSEVCLCVVDNDIPVDRFIGEYNCPEEYSGCDDLYGPYSQGGPYHGAFLDTPGILLPYASDANSFISESEAVEPVEIDFYDHSSDSKSGITSEPPLRFGKYRVRIAKDRGGYVGGCIRKNGPHVHVHLKDTDINRDVFNFHIMTWYNSNGFVCFGIYESVSRKCFRFCGDELWRGIRDSIYTVLVAYMAVSLARTIAAAAATAAVAALVVLPGVPPPP